MTITEEAIRFIWGQVDKLFVRKNDVQQEVNSSTNPVSSAAVKAIVDRLSGIPIVPKGSIEFSNLPTLTDASIGDLYNIKDNFITTDNFIEGAGAKIAAGTNVVCVEENLTKKWDCFGTNFEVDNEPVQNSNNPISSNAVYNLKQVVDGLSGGTAKAAEKLATARNIATTPFDGTADIDISYNNLIDKPTIPTVSNDLTNELKAKYDAAAANSHTHSNKEILNGTTAAFTTELKEKVETPYLPKAGGTMTGNIDTATNKTEIIVNANKSKVKNLTVVAGGAIEKSGTMISNLPSHKSFVGSFKNTEKNSWYNVISTRHRNGYDDGDKRGMMIYSDMGGTNSNLRWDRQGDSGTWQGERVLLDSTNYSGYAAKSDHTHAMITNSATLIGGANNAAKWYRLGVLVSSGDFANAVIRVWSGDGASGRAYQNASFEIQIKDGRQYTLSADNACGVAVYRIGCDNVKVKVIPTAHDTYTVWVYLPWGYWDGNYAVYGKYKSWTSQKLIQSEEPEGTGANTAYYDQAFLSSTVAKATALTETPWLDVPRDGADPTSERKLKYLIMGNTVYVQGYLKLSDDNNNPKCGTLPSRARPNDTLYFTGWDPASSLPTAYPIVVTEAGIIQLHNPTATAYWFKSGRAYRFNFSYHIG